MHLPISDYLITTNLHLISYRFQVIADYWSNLHFQLGSTSLLHTRSGWTPKLRTRKFGLKKLETSLYREVQTACRYLEPFRRGSRVWRTDGQTDWLTDRTAVSISNSAVRRPAIKNCTRKYKILFYVDNLKTDTFSGSVSHLIMI